MSRARLLMVILSAFIATIQSCPGQTVRPQQQAAKYATALRLPLYQRANGIEGYLELRQDARLTRKLKDLMWGAGDIDIDDDPALAIFKNEPPRNAIIQVVDRAGNVMNAQTLERPLAKLSTEQLYGDSRLTYLLTVDYSAGFGSYSGPITSLIEVKGGHLRWVESTEAKTGHVEKIGLMDSLKTTWKFVDSPNKRGKEILSARCRPDWASVKDNQDFTITYTRIYFNGTKWFRLERRVKGFSEFEAGFPSRKNFP